MSMGRRGMAAWSIRDHLTNRQSAVSRDSSRKIDQAGVTYLIDWLTKITVASAGLLIRRYPRFEPWSGSQLFNGPFRTHG